MSGQSIIGLATAAPGTNTAQAANTAFVAAGDATRAIRAGEQMEAQARAVAGTTALALLGFAAQVAVGTATARPSFTSAAPSLFAETEKVGIVSVATAGGAAARPYGPNCVRGLSAQRGGFDFTIRCGASDPAAVADARCFYGLGLSNAAIANANPSTFFNIVGLGADSGEANLSLMHNGAAGTAVKVPLGPGFPANTLSVDMYLLRVFCPMGLNQPLTWNVLNLTTGVTATGTIAGTVGPAAGVFIGAIAWRNNGLTALAVAVDVAQITLVKPT